MSTDADPAEQVGILLRVHGEQMRAHRELMTIVETWGPRLEELEASSVSIEEMGEHVEDATAATRKAVESLETRQSADDKRTAVNSFAFRWGASLVGMLAAGALSVATWALARSEEVAVHGEKITSLEEADRSAYAVRERLDGRIDSLDHDVTNIAAEVRGMESTLQTQDAHLQEALREMRARPRR